MGLAIGSCLGFNGQHGTRPSVLPHNGEGHGGDKGGHHGGVRLSGLLLPNISWYGASTKFIGP